MRFFQAMFLGLFLLSNAEGRGEFHVKGPFDLDGNKLNECLVFNGKTHSILFVETLSPQKNDTLWTYTFEDGITVADGNVIDLDNDGFVELVIIPEIINIDDNKPWLYVFKGMPLTFADKPLSYTSAPLSLISIRPSSLTIIDDPSYSLGVFFASPIRRGMVFNLKIFNGRLNISNAKLLSNRMTNSGYSIVQMSSFSTGKRDYVSIISAESDSLHATIFDVKNDFGVLESATNFFNIGPLNLNTSLMARISKNKGKDGLLLPIGTDSVFLLNIVDSSILVSSTNTLKKEAFPSDNQNNLFSLLKSRENVVALRPINSNVANPFNKFDENNLPAFAENSSIKPLVNEEEVDSGDKAKQVTSKINQKSLGNRSKKISATEDYKLYTPTLGDFLKDLDKKNNDKEKDLPKTTVPKASIDMKSNSWADEAGFTYIDLAEYTSEEVDTLKSNPIPFPDTVLTKFTDEVMQSLTLQDVREDSIVNYEDEDEIDLYYVLVMTPATGVRDRYVFDGEVPFGVAVNQVPPTGSATHFQHGISADLANLNPGEKYDFAYSLRDGYKDTITTFTMVHDLQTNIVLMSISPTADSISQSYQPESFDPKLFEFPNYFFEGFPTSLDMDFTDKLIRFSFDGVEDSSYQGLYLSSTTPSNPPQSLAIFLDQGKIQSVKGEVVVRANGSKKITTQFDLEGSVEPSLMFSKLIQESFPEDLKVKLLQGASLEEPLFGPKGKIPKIIREPRLPEAQLALPQQRIPVSPKQTVIPEISSQILKSNVSNKALNVEPLKNDETFLNSKLNKQDSENETSKIDSLNLESSKNFNKSNPDKKPPVPEKNQSEIQHIISDDE